VRGADCVVVGQRAAVCNHVSTAKMRLSRPVFLEASVDAILACSLSESRASATAVESQSSGQDQANGDLGSNVHSLDTPQILRHRDRTPSPTPAPLNSVITPERPK
jgi:hypothetical protein